MADAATAMADAPPATGFTCPTFTRFDDAYLGVLRHVLERAEFFNAPRGNTSRECLNVSFQLTDPRARVTYLAARKVNIVFHWAEALWYLWARNDLDMIAYYAPQIRAYSADGTTLTGSAYGQRLFRPLSAELPSAWELIERAMATDPASKRAVATFFRPEELADERSPDVACIIALQFLQRQGRLHTVAYMRANDAVQGLLSDVFSFTLIGEVLARQLGLELGSYAHHVGSMHIAERDVERVRRILADSDTDTDPAGGAGRRVSFPVATMPPGDPWPALQSIEEWEGALRRNERRAGPAVVTDLGLDSYWQQVVLLFEVYRQIVHHPDRPVSGVTLDALSPGNRWLITRRWPERMPDNQPKAARS